MKKYFFPAVLAIALSFSLNFASASTFSPEELNALRAQATQEIDQYFSNTPPHVLNELAMMYFNNRADASNMELISSYRIESIIAQFHTLLKERHPDKVLDELEWVWNNVGGVNARLAILACDPFEYVAVFGTALAQQGFSGRYPHMDVYDIMISGEMESFGAASENAMPVMYREGDVCVTKKTESTYYNMNRMTYMIDYGRGNIAPALWDGVIAPYLFRNHDSYSASKQLSSCAKSVFKSIQSKFSTDISNRD